jgi:hypothetical protein
MARDRERLPRRLSDVILRDLDACFEMIGIPWRHISADRRSRPDRSSGIVRCYPLRRAILATTTLFARFRTVGQRLHVSVVETRRDSTKVRQEHLASLGSIPQPPTSAERIAFWTKLHERLARLANRTTAEQRGQILAAVHARIPMPTPDEQHAVQLENARADARFWQILSGMQAEDIEAHKKLLASTQRAIAEREQTAAETAARGQASDDRLARTEAGEAVAVPPPMTRKDMLRISGMTEAEARHCVQVHEIDQAGGWQMLLDEWARRSEASRKATVRQLHRLLMLMGRAPPNH